VLIENDFVVKAPVETVWAFLLDVDRVAPCMPGAQLTDVVDDHTWKGKTSIKVGPVSLSFAGTVVIEERDDAAHRVRLKANGREQRGKGAASASVVSRLEETGEGTKVAMQTDLTITGAVAQYGRGMILDISQRMTKEFAGCLQASIAAGQTGPPAQPGETGEAGWAAPAAQSPTNPPSETGTRDAPTVETTAERAAPVKGFRLAGWALWRAVVRFFRRLLGRGQ
jgi:carbon monoxide dehydrogenase subunit G